MSDNKPVAWLDCWGDPHKRREDAMQDADSTPEPLYTRAAPPAPAPWSAHPMQGWMDSVAPPATELPELPEPWRATVDDMLTVCHMTASDDPRESVNRLINWHVSVALDPCVSSDAQALIDQGAALAADRAARVPVLTDELRELEQAEAHYRLTFQIAPSADHLDVGRAWDRMKKAGDKARAVLAATQGSKP